MIFPALVGLFCSCSFDSFYGSYFAVVYNIPTYFQATAGLSPRDSGIRTIPIIGATCELSTYLGAKSVVNFLLTYDQLSLVLLGR